MPEEAAPASDGPTGVHIGRPVLGGSGQADYDSRQLRYLHAVRSGNVDEADKLLSIDLGAAAWRVHWATATDLDPRMRRQAQVGAFTCMAGGTLYARPVVGVSVRTPGGSGGSAEQIQLHELDTGRVTTLPSVGAECMSFAGVPGDPILVTGHTDGSLRVWDLNTASLRSRIDAGGGEVGDLFVADLDGRAVAAVLDSRGRLVRAGLTPEIWIDELEASGSNAMCGGRLSDGRHVVVVAGERLTLWELATGRRELLPMRGRFHNVVSLVLSTSEGRDILTVLTDVRQILSFDMSTGQPLGPVIDDHANQIGRDRMLVWSPPGRYPKLAVVSGIVAVPTRWQVHLWGVRSSQQEASPLAGPVAAAQVQSLRWRDRDYLLTGSAADGTVALFDLGVTPPSDVHHECRIVSVTTAGVPQVVVSVDRSGTVIARNSDDGALASQLRTNVEGPRSLVAWEVDGRVQVAIGAGSRSAPDGRLRRWDLARAELLTPVIEANEVTVNLLARIAISGSDIIVTFRPGSALGMWRAVDGEFVGDWPTKVYTRVTGFAAGLVEGRPSVVLSTYRGKVTIYPLDGENTPRVIPEIGSDFVVGLVADGIITGSIDDGEPGWRTLRCWDFSGRRMGPSIHFDAEILAVRTGSWPAAYVACGDSSISLVDLETGSSRCPPMRLPLAPNSLAMTATGDLVVGFGNDVALVRPPAG